MAGVWVWGVAAAVGVSAILLASATAYTVVRYLGAAYLIYLGVRMVVEARRAGGLVLGKTSVNDTPVRAMVKAFMVTLTNPKNGAFYVAILPQFVPVDMNPILAGLALATIHNLLVLVWFTAVIFLTNLAKNFFAKPRVGQTMEYVSGAALFGFGVKMALERA
jgi:threonine/homoserine/homoserine lactone efflux protein